MRRGTSTAFATIIASLILAIVFVSLGVYFAKMSTERTSRASEGIEIYGYSYVNRSYRIVIYNPSDRPIEILKIGYGNKTLWSGNLVVKPHSMRTTVFSYNATPIGYYGPLAPGDVIDVRLGRKIVNGIVNTSLDNTYVRWFDRYVSRLGIPVQKDYDTDSLTINVSPPMPGTIDLEIPTTAVGSIDVCGYTGRYAALFVSNDSLRIRLVNGTMMIADRDSYSYRGTGLCLHAVLLGNGTAIINGTKLSGDALYLGAEFFGANISNPRLYIEFGAYPGDVYVCKFIRWNKVSCNYTDTIYFSASNITIDGCTKLDPLFMTCRYPRTTVTYYVFDVFGAVRMHIEFYVDWNANTVDLLYAFIYPDTGFIRFCIEDYGCVSLPSSDVEPAYVASWGHPVASIPSNGVELTLKLPYGPDLAIGVLYPNGSLATPWSASSIRIQEGWTSIYLGKPWLGYIIAYNVSRIYLVKIVYGLEHFYVYILVGEGRYSVYALGESYPRLEVVDDGGNRVPDLSEDSSVPYTDWYTAERSHVLAVYPIEESWVKAWIRLHLFRSKYLTVVNAPPGSVVCLYGIEKGEEVKLGCRAADDAGVARFDMLSLGWLREFQGKIAVYSSTALPMPKPTWVLIRIGSEVRRFEVQWIEEPSRQGLAKIPLGEISNDVVYLAINGSGVWVNANSVQSIILTDSITSIRIEVGNTVKIFVNNTLVHIMPATQLITVEWTYKYLRVATAIDEYVVTVPLKTRAVWLICVARKCSYGVLP